MNVDLLTALAEAWRAEAERFRTLGLERAANMSEAHAQELEEQVREWKHEELTISEAAREVGYTKGRLREMVREGILPDNRPVDYQGRIFLRRCDLPRKPRSDEPDDLEEFAEKILRSRA